MSCVLTHVPSQKIVHAFEPTSVPGSKLPWSSGRSTSHLRQVVGFPGPLNSQKKGRELFPNRASSHKKSNSVEIFVPERLWRCRQWSPPGRCRRSPWPKIACHHLQPHPTSAAARSASKLAQARSHSSGRRGSQEARRNARALPRRTGRVSPLQIVSSNCICIWVGQCHSKSEGKVQ